MFFHVDSGSSDLVVRCSVLKASKMGRGQGWRVEVGGGGGGGERWRLVVL